jgi:small subunit ribosomal protein S6
MRRYETIVIIRPGCTEEDRTEIIDKSKSIIEGEEGEVLKVDQWGLKKLSYLIKKENQGYYVYFVHASTPAAVNEIERIYRIDDKVLKYITVKLQDVYTPDEPDETVDSEEASEETTEETTEKTTEETTEETTEKNTDE